MITVHVREIALSQGIRNARQLALAAGFAPNLGVRLWDDKFQQIDKRTMDRLCRALECQPGDLLKYQPDKVSKSASIKKASKR